MTEEQKDIRVIIFILALSAIATAIIDCCQWSRMQEMEMRLNAQ